MALTDSAGNTIETYAYDVYGRPGNTSNVANPYFFTARRFDTLTGLYYYRARYYSTRIGRFLQADPAGYLDGVNLYANVGNNPLVFVDPFGLCKESGSGWIDWAQGGLDAIVDMTIGIGTGDPYTTGLGLIEGLEPAIEFAKTKGGGGNGTEKKGSGWVYDSWHVDDPVDVTF